MLEERSQELAALTEINRALAQSSGLDEVLERIVAEAARLTRADGAGIAFLRAGNDELEVGPSLGILSAPPNRRFPLHRSITGRVVRRGIAEVIPDVGRDPDQYPLEPDPVPTRSAIAVPLRADSGVIGGILVLRGPELPPYNEEQRLVLQRFADQAAIAIEHARVVERLAEANRVKDDFLSSLSHELRTPLTGILLWADILASDPAVSGCESLAEGVAIITQSGELLLSMVEDLLDLSRLRSGRLVLEKRSLDLRVIVRQVLEAHRRSAEELDLRLIEETAEVPLVEADPLRIRQVLTHLVANALKFTDAPGRVTVRLRTDGVRVLLEVADTGAGIAPELLPRIFERFRHGPPPPGQRKPGLGVGLALAQALVEAHGGRIRVESEPGAGSTFTIELPAASERDEVEPPVLEGPGAAPDSDQGPTVLLVEDVLETRQALATVLRSRGYAVLEAEAGESAIRLASQRRPDVVVLDIGLPDLDGVTVLDRLRREPETAKIPVAAITARALAEDRHRMEAAAFDAFLLKPFRIPDLLGTLEKLLAAGTRQPL